MGLNMKTYLVFSVVLLFPLALILMMRADHNENQIVIPIEVGENIKENKYFDFLGEILDPLKKNEKYIVATLDNVCSSCMSGQLLFWLERLQRERKDIQSFIVLPNKYSADDLTNIKNNYNLRMNFKRMPQKLEDFTQSNKKSLSREGIIGSIFIIDSNGEVKLVYLIKTDGDTFQEIVAWLAKESI